MAQQVQVLPLPAIAQEELEFLIGLRNQINSFQKIYEQRAEDVMRRRAAGCQVELGIHSAELREIQRGPIRTIKLIVK